VSDKQSVEKYLVEKLKTKERLRVAAMYLRNTNQIEAFVAGCAVVATRVFGRPITAREVEQCLTGISEAEDYYGGAAVVLEGLDDRHVVQAVEREGLPTIQAPKTVNALRTIELHPSVSRLLKSFVGPRTSGYIFPSSIDTPVHQSNFLRREFHPVLKAAEIPKAGFHGFRRYRNTFLRNVARCPSGLPKYWMGHADKDMSDLYDKVREDPTFRRAEARRMGVGFAVPKKLKATKAKSDRFVVRRVVRDSHTEPPK
jgi:hypothetical protein